MDRSVGFAVGNFYHIYNRGVNKQVIYADKRDYERFQKLLYSRNSTKRIESNRIKKLPLNDINRGETIVDIAAYALMPNHFHLLLHEKQENGISTFMSKLGTAYAMYVNTKYERTGPLMCRPFRSKYIDNDDYLRWVLSYIHLNPLELGDKSRAESLYQYKYSSFLDFYGKDRDETSILNKNCLPFDISELEDLATMKHIIAEADYGK